MDKNEKLDISKINDKINFMLIDNVNNLLISLLLLVGFILTISFI